MANQSFEGTWEEVAEHAVELAGRRVRLTVLDAPSEATPALEQSLARVLAEAEALSEEDDPHEGLPTESDWGRSVVEKFRKQGFRL